MKFLCGATHPISKSVLKSGNIVEGAMPVFCMRVPLLWERSGQDFAAWSALTPGGRLPPVMTMIDKEYETQQHRRQIHAAYQVQRT
jgi:hypothetical protein